MSPLTILGLLIVAAYLLGGLLVVLNPSHGCEVDGGDQHSCHWMAPS